MSKRINKEMAYVAAANLTKIAFEKKKKEALKKFQDFGLKLYEKYVPEDIRKIAESRLEYFESSYMLKFLVSGASSWDYIALTIEDEHYLPLRPIILTREDWNELKKLKDICNTLSDEEKEYLADCQQALINLRTEKNVKEQFPEALPYLDFSECTALVPCLDNLRNKLK